MFSILLSVLVAAKLSAAQGQDNCSYRYALEGYEDGVNEWCIKSYVAASATFSLPPLLPSPVSFVYAADELTSDDSEETGGNLDNVRVPEGVRHTAAAFWLDYNDSTTNWNDTVDVPLETALRVFFPLLPDGQVGGGHGGCEDLLGNDCIDSITKTLRDFTFKVKEGVKTSAFDEKLVFGGVDFPLDLLDKKESWGNVTGCPSDLFSQSAIVANRGFLVLGPSADFAAQFPDDSDDTKNDGNVLYGPEGSYIVPSGNDSYTYGRKLYRDRPLAEQEQRPAVAIMLRYQILGSYYKQTRIRDDKTFDLAFACAKLPVTSNSNTDGDDNKGGDGGAAGNQSDKDGSGVKLGVQTSVAAMFALAASLAMYV